MSLRTFQQYIDGQFEPGKQTFESINPATGQPWAVMPAATADDVDRAVFGVGEASARSQRGEGDGARRVAVRPGAERVQLRDLRVGALSRRDGDAARLFFRRRFMLSFVAEQPPGGFRR